MNKFLLIAAIAAVSFQAQAACFGGYDSYGKPCGSSMGGFGNWKPAPSGGYGDPSDRVNPNRFGETSKKQPYSYDRPRYQGCGKGKSCGRQK